MSDHDPLCPWRKSEWIGAKGTECPHCRMIAQVVAREQERSDAEVKVLAWELLNVRADRLDLRAQVMALPYVLTYGTAEVKRDDVLALFDGSSQPVDTGPHEPLTLDNVSRLLVNTLRFLIDEFGRAGVQNTLALIDREQGHE